MKLAVVGTALVVFALVATLALGHSESENGLEMRLKLKRHKTVREALIQVRSRVGVKQFFIITKHGTRQFEMTKKPTEQVMAAIRKALDSPRAVLRYESDGTVVPDTATFADVDGKTLFVSGALWEPDSFPDCDECRVAYYTGVVHSKGPDFSTQAWAKEDILEPFNPWRVLNIARTNTHLKLGSLAETAPGSANSETKKQYARVAEYKRKFDEWAQAREVANADVEEFTNCDFTAKNTVDGAKAPLDTNWPGECIMSHPDTLYPNFRKLEAMWYYLGLVAGFLGKNEEVFAKTNEYPVYIQFDYAMKVPDNQQARPAGWHIDGSYYQKNDVVSGSAPIYFVAAQKFPTYFLTGAELLKLLKEEHIAHLEEFKCGDRTTKTRDMADDCLGELFLQYLFGGAAGTAGTGIFNTEVMQCNIRATPPLPYCSKPTNAVGDAVAPTGYRRDQAAADATSVPADCYRGVKVVHSGDAYDLALMGPYQVHMSGVNKSGAEAKRWFLRIVVNHWDKRPRNNVFLEETEDEAEENKDDKVKQEKAAEKADNVHSTYFHRD